MKYAIYQTENNCKTSWEYYDNIEELKSRGYTYISASDLPVVVNDCGGYHHFAEEYETENGFVELRDEPLSFAEMYPKNNNAFNYGWIAPNGDSYTCNYSDHYDCARCICEDKVYELSTPEIALEQKGWLRVGKYDGKRFVFILGRITKAQEKALIQYNLITKEVEEWLYLQSLPDKES